MQQSIYINGQELTLKSLEAYCWELLGEGIRQPGSAFRTMSFANTGPDGPAIRTVVLRKVRPFQRTLYFYTDKRSPKYTALHETAKVAAVLYDEATKIQLSLKGFATLHEWDDTANEEWTNTTTLSQQAYRTKQPPSSTLAAPGSNLVPAQPGTKQAGAAAVFARQNFSVVALHITWLDFLQLKRTGNIRAGFSYNVNGALEKTTWLTP